MKLLLRIAFVGSGFCGFQTQPNGRTVQSVLTDVLSRVVGIPCSLTGCSRTDSGVHAECFCATLEPANPDADRENWCPIPVSKFHRAANVALPPDVSVLSAAAVTDDFHPRYSVRSKTYEYRICDRLPRDPFLENRAWHVLPLNDDAVRRMEECAALYPGAHDFSGFMSAGSKITDTVRTVYSADVFRRPDGILCFRVSADGFLYNMVRIMTGTLVDYSSGRLSLDSVREALAAGNRRCAGATAPPHGLYLTNVTYDREIHWQCD